MKKLRLLFLVTEDWYFVSHRLDLALAAKIAGYEVTVATRLRNHGEQIRNLGIKTINFEMSRRGGNPVNEIFRLIRLFRSEKPDIVHLVAMKPAVYGGVAAAVTKIPQVVVAVAGLGWLFTSEGTLQRILQPVFRKVLAWLLSQRRFTCIVQNADDFDVMRKAGVPVERLKLIKGSGVDTELFTPPQQTPPAPVTVLLVARMLWDKGVGEFVEAAKILKNRFKEVRFVLVGDPDPANPAVISENILSHWSSEKTIEWWGRRENILDVLHQGHIACLPSYREGLPKSLLEAAAVGLPIVTTDAPGCREVVKNGWNGFLVPVRDSHALAEALEKLITDHDLRVRMGKKSREKAIEEFASPLVNQQVLNIYRVQKA